MRVLLVDDSRTFTQHALRLLNSIELVSSIEICDNGDKALTALKNGSFDIALLDIYLPDVSGLELLKTIRSSDELMQIFIVTAKKDLVTVKEAFAYGANDYISKTMDDLEFLSRINAALRLRKEMGARVYAEKLLSEKEAHLRRITDNMQDMIAQVNLQGVFSYASYSYKKILDYGVDELIGKSLFGFVHPSDLLKTRRAFTKGKLGGEPQTIEMRFRSKSGSFKWLETIFSFLLEQGVPAEAVISSREITAKKRAQAKVEYLRFHDTLTGLYNRDFFEEQLLRLDTARQLPFTIVVGDTNGLKLVNDAFGHREGDKLLTKISAIMRHACRQEDTVCRWGGDEFAMLLPQTTAETGQRVCERIVNACKKASPTVIPLSISLGVATKDDPQQNISDIFRKAETMMYKTKLAETNEFRRTVVASLIRALGEKDFETEEHSWRLQSLAVSLGESMNLTDNELSNLVLVVTLHDVGKMAVSEEILMKPEPLTGEEWEKIKEHSEAGYRIALSLSELAHVAPCILSHHERWDGTGYPQGLKGEEIPLLARIVAVLDAFDVMTHGRPYRKALSPELALMEIKRCAGTQFDPSVTDYFVKMQSAVVS